MAKTDLVFEKLTEISERIAKVETQFQYISDDVREIKHQDLIQNRLLDEHIAGVNSVKELVKIESEKLDMLRKETDHRLKKVETPLKFVQTNKKALIWIGSIASALAGIAKLSGLL